MFKRKKKTYMKIDISDNDVEFSISWDKNNIEIINLLTKIIFMLNNGDLEQHIENAIKHAGLVSQDIETASQIISTVKKFKEQIGESNIRFKYFNNMLLNDKRDPLIAPDQVFDNFKNLIVQ